MLSHLGARRLSALKFRRGIMSVFPRPDGVKPFQGRSSGGLRAAMLTALMLGTAVAAQAQAQKRCDLAVKSTPGAGADSTCLDLESLTKGGTGIQTAGNV